MKKHLQVLLGLLVVSSLLLVACGGTPAANTAAPGEATTAPEEPSGPVEVRWFVGLGAGAQPEQLAGQEADGCGYSPKVIDARGPALVFDGDAHPDVVGPVQAWG